MFALALWDRRAAAAGPGARPGRQEAALLRADPRPPFCSARRSRRCWPGRECRASPNLARDRRLPDAAIRAVAGDRLCSASRSCRRRIISRPRRMPRRIGATPSRSATGNCRSRDRRSLPSTRRPCTRAGGNLAGGGAAAHDRRRAARRLPVGRHRFERGRRDDGARRRRPGQDLLDRLLRPRNTTRPAMPAWSRERYGTEHEEFVVEPDAVAVLPQLVWHYGEPFADPSAIPTYYVSQLARRHVTVALNGDGGDEAFLGYSRYRAMRHLTGSTACRNGARHGLARALRLAPAGVQRRLRLGQIREALSAETAEPVQPLRPDDRVLRRRATRRPAMARRCRSDLREFGARPPRALFRRRRRASSPAPTGPICTPTCPTI